MLSVTGWLLYTVAYIHTYLTILISLYLSHLLILTNTAKTLGMAEDAAFEVSIGHNSDPSSSNDIVLCESKEASHGYREVTVRLYEQLKLKHDFVRYVYITCCTVYVLYCVYMYVHMFLYVMSMNLHYVYMSYMWYINAMLMR